MSSPVERAKRSWHDWLELAAWLFSLAAPLVLTLPRLSPLSSGGTWRPLILYLLIAVCILASLVIRRWRLPWLATAGLALACLGVGLWTLGSYRRDYFLWSCEYAGRGPVIVGSDDRMVPQVAAYRRSRNLTCTEIIEDIGGNTEAIWPREQIIDRYERLGWRYTVIILSLSSAAFFLLEALKAFQRRRR